MVDSKDTPEKTSLHQFEDTTVQGSPYSADLKQDGLVADAEASSLGPPTFEGVDGKSCSPKDGHPSYSHAEHAISVGLLGPWEYRKCKDRRAC